MYRPGFWAPMLSTDPFHDYHDRGILPTPFLHTLRPSVSMADARHAVPASLAHSLGYLCLGATLPFVEIGLAACAATLQ